MFELDEPLRSIMISRQTIKWDIELLESYLLQYANGEIQGTIEDKIQVSTALEEVNERLKAHTANYAEHLI